MQRLDEATLEPVSVSKALADLLFKPGRLLLRWNWKTALLSASARGTIFFISNIGAGMAAAAGAMTVEAALFAALAGFYGAIAQTFRHAQPAWAATTVVVILIPVVNHTLEYTMHHAHGTKKIVAGIIASIALSIISSVFNLFAMRQGVLIVGEGKTSLIDDLKRLPRIIFDFLMIVPRALWRIK